MSAKPKKLFWVDLKLSEKGKRIRHSAGVRGGKRSSMEACELAKKIILRADPDAQVRIYEADVEWREVIPKPVFTYPGEAGPDVVRCETRVAINTEDGPSSVQCMLPKNHEEYEHNSYGMRWRVR